MLRGLAGYALFVATRLAGATLTVLGVAALVFFGMRMIPGSYEDIFFILSTPEEKAAIAAQYGLDRPVWEQFALWLGHMAEGDFGTSIVTRRPVAAELLARLPLTFELGLLALLVIALVGLPAGVLAGLRHRSRASQLGRHGSTFLMSVPDFVLGSLAVYLFSAYALGLRAGGWVPLSEGLLENLRHALLPALTLATTGLGLTVATARASTLGVMSQDHVLAAVSRGLSEGAIFRRHILRNALIPLVTIFAIIAGYLLGGAVLVETIYNLDGVGRLIVDAIASRDYPVVQTGVLLTAGVFVLMNTLADLVYGLIDPRVAERRHG